MLFLTFSLGEKPLVATAASLIRNLCYEKREQISAGFIVAGWDEKLGGQVYFYLLFNTLKLLNLLGEYLAAPGALVVALLGCKKKNVLCYYLWNAVIDIM